MTIVQEKQNLMKSSTISVRILCKCAFIYKDLHQASQLSKTLKTRSTRWKGSDQPNVGSQKRSIRAIILLFPDPLLPASARVFLAGRERYSPLSTGTSGRDGQLKQTFRSSMFPCTSFAIIVPSTLPGSSVGFGQKTANNLCAAICPCSKTWKLVAD